MVDPPHENGQQRLGSSVQLPLGMLDFNVFRLSDANSVCDSTHLKAEWWLKNQHFGLYRCLFSSLSALSIVSLLHCDKNKRVILTSVFVPGLYLCYQGRNLTREFLIMLERHLQIAAFLVELIWVMSLNVDITEELLRDDETDLSLTKTGLEKHLLLCSSRGKNWLFLPWLLLTDASVTANYEFTTTIEAIRGRGGRP